MLPHDREEYKQQMGHVWLGFGDDQLRRLLTAEGFDGIRIVPLPVGSGSQGPGAVRRIGHSHRLGPDLQVGRLKETERDVDNDTV